MNLVPQFADVLKQYIDASHYSLGQLSRLSGIPKSTIVNWLQGRVKRPRTFDDLLKLAAIIHLSEAETTRLLKSSGHPSLEEIVKWHGDDNTSSSLSTQLKEVKEQRPNTPFQVIPDTQYFVGRQQELRLLKQYMMLSESNKICSLQGMAGAGKTTLAVHLAYQLRAYYPDGVLWARVSTSNSMSILSAFAYAYGHNIHQYGDLESRSQIVRNILANKQALIILDDVQTSADLEYLLPPTGKCAVIITTRNNNLLITSGAYRFQMGGFSKKDRDSLALFKKILGPSFLQKDQRTLEKIADIVAHLPLAIAVIASRLSYEPEWSAERFLERLQQAGEKLSQLVYEHQSVRLSVDISYHDLSEQQKKFFAALSVFGNEDFDTVSVSNILSLPPQETTEKLRLLYRFSLVQLAQNDRYSLHPLIQDYAAEKLEDPDIEVAMIEYFVDYAFKHRTNPPIVGQVSSNIEYALALAHQKKYFEAFIRGVIAYHRYLHPKGAYSVAENNLQAAEQVARSINNKHKLAVILHYLGQIKDKLGYLVQASDYLQESLSLAKEVNSAETMGGILTNLGIVMAKQGFLEQADQYWLQALKYTRQAKVDENEAALLSNLGATAAIRGDYQKAEVYYEKGLQVAYKKDQEHRVLHLLINLGSLIHKQGKQQDSSKLLQDALALSQKLNHVNELSASLYHLGLVAQSADDYKQAAQFFRQGLSIAEKHGLKNRVSLLLASLGEILSLEGENRQAKTYMMASLVLAREASYKNHISDILNKWGNFQLRAGQVDSASEAFNESLELATTGEAQELKALALYGLARVAYKKEEVVEAYEMGQRSYTILQAMGHMKAEEIYIWLTALPSHIHIGSNSQLGK